DGVLASTGIGYVAPPSFDSSIFTFSSAPRLCDQVMLPDPPTVQAWPANGVETAMNGGCTLKSAGLVALALNPAGGLAHVTATRALVVGVFGAMTLALFAVAVIPLPPESVVNSPAVPAVLS